MDTNKSQQLQTIVGQLIDTVADREYACSENLAFVPLPVWASVIALLREGAAVIQAAEQEDPAVLVARRVSAVMFRAGVSWDHAFSAVSYADNVLTAGELED